MKPLEYLIRDSARRGDLNYLSIAISDEGWTVAYRGVANEDHRIVSHRDPVCAMVEALTGKRAKKQAEPATTRNGFEDLLG